MDDTKISNYPRIMPKITIQPHVYGWNRLPCKEYRRSPYNIWKDAYEQHLLNLYLICNDNCFESEERFEKFCKLVYSKSSKYITPFL